MGDIFWLQMLRQRQGGTEAGGSESDNEVSEHVEISYCEDQITQKPIKEHFFFNGTVQNTCTFPFTHCNILDSMGNPDHMICDVADDIETCLQTAPFSLFLGLLKAILTEQNHWVFKVCWISMPTDEVARFIMDSRCNGGKCDKENILGEEVDANLDPDDGDKSRDSDYPEENVKEATEPSESRGGVFWEKYAIL